MNDDFLNALRRDPPPQFARRLKQRLQAQEEQSKRRRTWSLRSLLFLIVGSAFASGMLVLERRAAERPEAAQVQSPTQATTTKQAPAGYRPGYLGPGFVPEGNSSARPNRFGDSSSKAASSVNNGLPAQSSQTAQSAGIAATTSEQMTSGDLIQSLMGPSIAVSPLAEGLVRSVFSGLAYRKSDEPRFQAAAADAAFSGLCAPGDTRQFDVVVSSRRIGYAEFIKCRENGVNRIIETKLGYQALVLTSARDSAPLKLTPGDVFLAISKTIPDPADPTRLIGNVNFSWDQVNSKFAYRPITVFGPARDTPLRLLFETLLLDPGCNVQRVLEAPQLASPEEQAEICHSLRTDRLYTEVEQNSALLTQDLWSDPHGFVLVDYSFYRDNQAQLGGSALEGPEPTYATMADGTYPLARPLYLYADENRMERAVLVQNAYRALQNLQYGRSNAILFGFIRVDDSEADKSWQRKAPLTISELIPASR